MKQHSYRWWIGSDEDMKRGPRLHMLALVTTVATATCIGTFFALERGPRGQNETSQAQSYLEDIDFRLEMHLVFGGELPSKLSQLDLARPWLGASETNDGVGLDPWGESPLYCRLSASRYWLVSMGRDRTSFTADDVVVNGGTTRGASTPSDCETQLGPVDGYGRDPWGAELLSCHLPHGREMVISRGPDGRRLSRDDLWFQRPFEKQGPVRIQCWQASPTRPHELWEFDSVRQRVLKLFADILD